MAVGLCRALRGLLRGALRKCILSECLAVVYLVGVPCVSVSGRIALRLFFVRAYGRSDIRKCIIAACPRRALRDMGRISTRKCIWEECHAVVYLGGFPA